MFRLLKADEIECRIAQISKTKPCVSLLLYKTARTDAKLLDETVGPMFWDCDYKVVDGTLYCGIGIIKDGTRVEKWDAGTESYTEKEKGRASDAFKRAGFKWGIGRELYSAPNIWVKANVIDNNGRRTTYDKFFVSKIDYDDNGEIDTLVILNQDGQEVYSMGKLKHVPAESTLKAKLEIVGVKDIKKFCQKEYGHEELEQFSNEEKVKLENQLDAAIKEKRKSQ